MGFAFHEMLEEINGEKGLRATSAKAREEGRPFVPEKSIDAIETIEDIGDLSLREFGSEEVPQVGDGHDGIVQEHARA